MTAEPQSRESSRELDRVDRQILSLLQADGRLTVAELARTVNLTLTPCIERVRRLVHYYRSTKEGLPGWLKHFVTTGYSHYATLLPAAFADRGTTPEQVAGMLAFLFTLESLALSLGCNRSQLIIAVQQSAPGTDDPNKLGLLWSAEWLLGLRSVEVIRAISSLSSKFPGTTARVPLSVSAKAASARSSRRPASRLPSSGP